MQIGNVYVDIRIKDRKNFVAPDQLKDFQLVETAGTSLPYVFVSFVLFDADLAGYFMQNNQVEVAIGSSEDNADIFAFHPMSPPQNTDPSGDSWTIAIGGFIGDNDYMMNSNVSKAYAGNSLMVVKKALKKFKKLNNEVDTDIEKTNENQVIWRQTLQTTGNFLVSTLLHMDIRPSFPLFTFDKYGKFHVRSYTNLRDAGPVWTFTPTPANGAKEFQYLNTFDVNNFKTTYNLYSGYNKMTEVYNTVKGIPEYVIDDNTPILASTKEAEKLPSGNRITLNKIKSGNVHNTYTEAYAFNTNKLISLSSMCGMLKIAGYHPELKPTDIVYVKTDKKMGADGTMEGYYIIDTVVATPVPFNGVFITRVYVTRDNKNHVEDYVAEKKSKKLNLTKKMIQAVTNAVSRARVALATCSQIMDGTFTSRCLSFLTESKNSILRMFSISGTMLDFSSQAALIQSFLCAGNTIMNVLLGMLFPAYIANTFRDFLIDNPSMESLLSKYIGEYVPYELQGIISSLVESLCGVQKSLNSIAEANGITARRTPEVASEEDSTYNETESTLNEIFEEFENNTTGLDIPFPIVSLTESQELMPVNELKDYVATETVQNLTQLGYMDGVDPDEFKDILVGNTPIDFSIINKINANAGDKLNYRFWGTYGASNEALYAWKYADNVVYTKTDSISEYARLYNDDYSPYMGKDFIIAEGEDEKMHLYYKNADQLFMMERDEEKDINSNALVQLTDFYINKGYKDRYRTLPCTKLISATKNARLYFACPQKETNIKFYINSKRVMLESFPIDLGYRDSLGNKIMYDVYYTTTGYNSNSTMLEIRQV